MTQSYRQLQKQIETLQRQADKLREQEIGGVIDRIKLAVAEYGLTADQLGLGSSSSSSKGKKVAGKKSARAGAKYSDENGNSWGGMGPRPKWLRDALDSGKSLDDFRSGRAAPAGGAVPSLKSAGKKAAAKASSSGATARRKAPKKRRATSQYRDEVSGKSWGGMGPRPQWLKDLLASGRTLEELALH